MSLTTKTMELPDECWESIFKFLDKPHHFDTLSLVSSHFLSITNNLVSSLKISNTHSLAYLPRLLTRFPNLRSLNLWNFDGDLDALLLQLSQSPSSLSALDSLKISILNSFPADGFLALAQKIPSLKSLTLNNDAWESFAIADILLPLRCFPLLEELYILHHRNNIGASNGPVSDSDIEALSLALPKLRKVKLCADYLINDSTLFNLCKNCEFLEVVKVSLCNMVSQDGIAGALKVRPNLTSLLFHSHQDQCISSVFIDSLVSLKHLTCLKLHSNVSDELLFSVARAGLPLRKFSLSYCWGYSYDGISFLLSRCRLIQHLDLGYSAEFLEDEHIKELSKFLGNLMSIILRGCDVSYLSFISLTMNCPLLNKINMDETRFGAIIVKDSDIIVNFQVKSITLIDSIGLLDDDVEILAKICPNLEVLDLGECKCISNGAVEVLKICKKIRYLSLRYHTHVNLSGMKNFQFPSLEVLILSFSEIDDKSLFILSKSCPGLLELDMKGCSEITAKGVKHVVKRCKQLKQVDLTLCEGVAPSVVAWMVSSRQSLRKICAPPQFRMSEREKELFLRRGCLVIVA